jgi:hypothetical protein
MLGLDVQSAANDERIEKVFNRGVHLQDGRSNHVISFAFEHPSEENAVFGFVDVVKNIIDLCYLAGQPLDFGLYCSGIFPIHERYYFARMPSWRTVGRLVPKVVLPE